MKNKRISIKKKRQLSKDLIKIILKYTRRIDRKHNIFKTIFFLQEAFINAKKITVKKTKKCVCECGGGEMMLL